MNTSRFLQQIINDTDNESIELEIFTQNRCSICKDQVPENQVYCDNCKKAIQRGYQISELAGRCRSGSDKTGILWHARLWLDEENRFNQNALCGAAPQGLSAGWGFSDNKNVTCKRCLVKMQSNGVTLEF